MLKGPGAEELTILRFPREDIPSKDPVDTGIEEAEKTVSGMAGLERAPFAVSATQHGLLDSKIEAAT